MKLLVGMVLPPLLGAAGAIAATLAPSYLALVCNGGALPLSGL